MTPQIDSENPDLRGEWGDEWHEVADIVVVGSGAAGATAAAIAAAEGASVIVLEAASLTGGTTAKSGGVMWVPNNPVMQAAGIVDERGAALRYWHALLSPHSSTRRVRPSV